jgi:3-oxoacyl-ACP reductase-like protein
VCSSDLSSTPQKKAAASAVAAAAAAAPAAASARATALDKRLTAALAQASLVLCWRGKHPGQILSRSLTVSAHAQRTLLLLSPITAGF